MSETLVVAEIVQGKFGPQVKDVAGNYYSFSQKYQGHTDFPPGTRLEAEVYVSDKGTHKNRYLNSAKVVRPEATAVVTPQLDSNKTFKEKDDTSMSKAEWRAKDRSQLIGGLCHDAAQLTLAAVTVGLKSEDVLKQFKEILDGLIQQRETVK